MKSWKRIQPAVDVSHFERIFIKNSISETIVIKQDSKTNSKTKRKETVPLIKLVKKITWCMWYIYINKQWEYKRNKSKCWTLYDPFIFGCKMNSFGTVLCTQIG